MYIFLLRIRVSSETVMCFSLFILLVYALLVYPYFLRVKKHLFFDHATL